MYYVWATFQNISNFDGKMRKLSERRYMKGNRERCYICRTAFMEGQKRMWGQGTVVSIATRLWAGETRV
jgi:hypothetical protein